ncbi:MAG TPA: GGDEF domain-containing protein [Steroidobacteraceae bacterium]
MAFGSSNTDDFTALETQRMRARMEEYIRVSRQGMLLAVAMHGIFGIFALAIGAPLLMYLQIVSVVVYAVTYCLSFHGYRRLIRGLTVLDLLGHSTLASWIIGVESGFQYYSWILLPLVFTSAELTERSRLRRALVLCAIYVINGWWLSRVTPLVQVDPAALEALRSFNLICYFTATTMSALAFTRATTDAEAKLREAADTDGLTGLLNRRRMSDRMQGLWQHARRAQRRITVLLLDIDHFKSINDRFGHACGDEVIVRVGDVLKRVVRQEDLVARWGGEEFMILLPDTPLEQAREIAERIRIEIGRIAFSFDPSLRVTATSGLAAWREGENLEATIHRADLMLLAGKRRGKNCIVVEGDALPGPEPAHQLAS